MKKEIALHYFFLIVFFALITISHRWFNIRYFLFWIGGSVGTLLPDVDHLLYVFVFYPHQLTSQRAKQMVTKGRVLEMADFLAQTRDERKKLIFHTFFFQILFFAVSFLILFSSSSLFGRGVVLAFMLHLFVDEVVDLYKVGNLENWFRQTPLFLNKKESVLYCLAVLVLILLFGFFITAQIP